MKKISSSAAALFAAAACCRCVAAAAASPGEGVVSFPLLTHRRVADRRRRELSSTVAVAYAAAASEVRVGERDDRYGEGSRRRRKLRRADDLQLTQQQLGALYQGYGTHYVDLWVGMPPQRQTVVVDTGSSATSFPCSECVNCGRHTDAPYDESKSSSFNKLTCDEPGTSKECLAGECSSDRLCVTEMDFQEAGHRSAFEAEDVVYAGGAHDGGSAAADDSEDPDDGGDGSDPLRARDFAFPLTFQCLTHVSGYFERQLADGVMGMDRRAQSFWGQMRASQVIDHARFSLCFVREPVASAAGTAAGAITLGGTDDRLHRTPMVYAKTVVPAEDSDAASQAAFRVHVRKMYLRERGGRSAMYDASSTVHAVNLTESNLNGPAGGFSLDSGTTDTYLTQSVSSEFRRVWKEITGVDYHNDHMKLTQDQLDKAPTLLLQMTPHEGGIGDEYETRDPSTVPGLAGKFDMSTPNDVVLAIPASHYMAQNNADGTYQARIHLDRKDDEGSVLGANALMGHDVMFDVDNARIGFAESECDYNSLVTKSGSASTQGGEENSEEGEGAEGGAEGDNSIQLNSDGEDLDDGVEFCSFLCRGLVAFVLMTIFVLFFLFARKYTISEGKRTRGERGGEIGGGGGGGPSSEFEMNGTVSPRTYSDDSENGFGAGGSINLSGGERGGYRDGKPPPPSSSDRSNGASSPPPEYFAGDGSHRSRDSHHSGRSRDSHRRISSREHDHARGSDHDRGRDRGHDRDYTSESSHRSRDSHHSRDSRGDRSNSRESRGDRSHHSRDSHRSLRSSNSRDSHRSHRSSSSKERGDRDQDRDRGDNQHNRDDRSQQSRDSHRSSVSRESHRSSGSRESRRSTSSPHRSSSINRDGSRSRSHHSDSDGGRRASSSSGGRTRREPYRDHYPDEIPLPPSIA